MGRQALTIRDGTITDFTTGILLGLSTGVNVERMRVGNNIGVGIRLGSDSIATGNIAYENGSDGILLGSNNIVTGNSAFDNEGDGIRAAFFNTISGNIARNNLGDGIEVDCPSNVIGNTATGNIGTNLVLNGADCNDIDNLAP